MTIQQILTKLADTGSIEATSKDLHLPTEEITARLRGLAASLPIDSPSSSIVSFHETPGFKRWAERGATVGVEFKHNEENGSNVIEVSSSVVPRSTVETFVTRLRALPGAEAVVIKLTES